MTFCSPSYFRRLTVGFACLGSAWGTPTQVPWPKGAPQPPLTYLGPEKVQEVGVDGLLKAGEMAAEWAGKARVKASFQLASKAGDLLDAGKAWQNRDLVRTAGILTWTLVKHGCPAADAADFAGKAVAAGLLSGRDFVAQQQLDEVYTGFARAEGRPEYGFRQGFLSRELRRSLRAQNPQFKEADLDRLEEAVLRTYCENRMYREKFTAFKQEVRHWLKVGGIRWSGDEASLEQFIKYMEDAERAIVARGAGAGLTEVARTRLARALLGGGKAGFDAAMAGYFSSFYGDTRDAKGQKLTRQPGTPPSATNAVPKIFRLTKVHYEPRVVHAVPGVPGGWEYTWPILEPGTPLNSTLELPGGQVVPNNHGTYRVTWQVPDSITLGEACTFRVQGVADYRKKGPYDGTFAETFSFHWMGDESLGLGGIALWRIEGPRSLRLSDSDTFSITLPKDFPARIQDPKGEVTLTFRSGQLFRPRFGLDSGAWPSTKGKTKAIARKARGLAFGPPDPSQLSDLKNVWWFVISGPCGTLYEYTCPQ